MDSNHLFHNVLLFKDVQFERLVQANQFIRLEVNGDVRHISDDGVGKVVAIDYLEVELVAFGAHDGQHGTVVLIGHAAVAVAQLVVLVIDGHLVVAQPAVALIDLTYHHHVVGPVVGLAPVRKIGRTVVEHVILLCRYGWSRLWGVLSVIATRA